MKESVFEKIVEACETKHINWAGIRSLVSSLGPEINDSYGDGTILSELYSNVGAYKQGQILLEITRLFLASGYDVHANDGMNGGECLRMLCWSSYDAYVLEIAEMLLDAGADPNYCCKEETDEDEEGVLEAVSWKLGSWYTGEYLSANLFEAYYRMIELAQGGEDYHGIRAGETCIGKQIKKIEKVSVLRGDDHTGSGELFLVWCDNLPLIITETVELFVDPSIDRYAVRREDVTERYQNMMGSRVEGFQFMDPCSAQLVLDNGRSLVIIGDESEDGSSVHLLDIESPGEAFLDAAVHIIGMYFPTGKQYSDGCRVFQEDSILLHTSSGNLLLYSEGEDYEEHQLRLLKIGQFHSKRMDRRLASRDIRFVDAYYTGTSLSGLHFLCDGKHFYLIATETSEIKLFLSEAPTDPSDIDDDSECMRIRFGEPTEAGFGGLSAEEDRLQLVEEKKKHLGLLLEHGSISKELYDSALHNLLEKMGTE